MTEAEIEAVARALYELKRSNLCPALLRAGQPPLPPWEEIGEAQTGYRSEGRAAITAHLAALSEAGYAVVKRSHDEDGILIGNYIFDSPLQNPYIPGRK